MDQNLFWIYHGLHRFGIKKKINLQQSVFSLKHKFYLRHEFYHSIYIKKNLKISSASWVIKIAGSTNFLKNLYLYILTSLRTISNSQWFNHRQLKYCFHSRIIFTLIFHMVLDDQVDTCLSRMLKRYFWNFMIFLWSTRQCIQMW